MKVKILISSILLMSSAFLHAQTVMNIHQNNGTMLQLPLNTIDSITYTISNPGNLAALTTLPIGNITTSGATSGGNVTNDGGSTITSRGIVWGISTNPTTADSITNDGNGTGSFTSNLSGLTASTTYYLRAYATNSAGTAYGNELSFTTLAQAFLAIGDTYQGGIIFYLDSNGGGLIAAPSDQSTGAQWGCYGTLIPGADGTAIGTGAQNTIDIINANCTSTPDSLAITGGPTAADICANLVLSGYTDWFLPSMGELSLLYFNIGQGGLGGFANYGYWSSTELDNDNARLQAFLNGNPFVSFKKHTFYVRAVRAF